VCFTSPHPFGTVAIRMDDITYWALAGLGAFTALLWMKVKGLEQKLKEQTPDAPSGGESSDAFVLRDHVPALRQVVFAQIWFSKEYAKTVMGFTDEELQQIKPKDVEWTGLPETFFPGFPIRIETWSTHTAISARDYTHPPLFHDDWRDPTGIWGHHFTGDGPSKGGWLSILLHNNIIIFSAQYGRFGGRPGGGPEDKYTFLTIPTRESEIEHYKSVPDPAEDPDLRDREFQWIRRYVYEDPRGIGWHLTIIDLVDRATKP
jgi:hypothetical protein